MLTSSCPADWLQHFFFFSSSGPPLSPDWQLPSCFGLSSLTLYRIGTRWRCHTLPPAAASYYRCHTLLLPHTTAATTYRCHILPLLHSEAVTYYLPLPSLYLYRSSSQMLVSTVVKCSILVHGVAGSNLQATSKLFCIKASALVTIAHSDFNECLFLRNSE